MSNLDTLMTAKTNLINNLASISANPKPTYSLDGQTIDWNTYQSMLMAQLAAINNLIVIESGPFEYITQGIT